MEFYYMEDSPPCRAVMLTAEAVGVKLDKKLVDLDKEETRTPEFLAMNPEGIVPTLKDGSFILWESRAICTYLATKYGDYKYYSKDAEERAQIDRLLYFDIGTLYESFKRYTFPMMFEGATELDETKKQQFLTNLQLLDRYLEGHQFAVGDRQTVADHSLIASVSSFVASGVDVSKYVNIVAWMSRCEKQMVGYNTVNVPGAIEFGEWLTKVSTFF